MDRHRVTLIVGLTAAGLLAIATLVGGDGGGATKPAPSPVTRVR